MPRKMIGNSPLLSVAPFSYYPKMAITFNFKGKSTQAPFSQFLINETDDARASFHAQIDPKQLAFISIKPTLCIN